MIKQQLEDTFEALAEQGVSHAKKAAKSAVQQISSSVSASKMWEQLLGSSSSTNESNKTSESLQTNKDHTPLNFEKLAKSYQDNDKQKTEQLKYRLHQLVKRGEEEVLQSKKQEEIEKKRQEAYEVENKKRKEEERKRQDSGSLPQGKVRKSIFSKKKVAQREQTEVKPSSGKQ